VKRKIATSPEAGTVLEQREAKQVREFCKRGRKRNGSNKRCRRCKMTVRQHGEE